VQVDERQAHGSHLCSVLSLHRQSEAFDVLIVVTANSKIIKKVIFFLYITRDEENRL
jgi:hypothetical protein